jgi:hypothetical protein
VDGSETTTTSETLTPCEIITRSRHGYTHTIVVHIQWPNQPLTRSSDSPLRSLQQALPGLTCQAIPTPSPLRRLDYHRSHQRPLPGRVLSMSASDDASPHCKLTVTPLRRPSMQRSTVDSPGSEHILHTGSRHASIPLVYITLPTSPSLPANASSCRTDFASYRLPPRLDTTPV